MTGSSSTTKMREPGDTLGLFRVFLRVRQLSRVSVFLGLTRFCSLLLTSRSRQQVGEVSCCRFRTGSVSIWRDEEEEEEEEEE
jgi:hypothetical protein